uniref:Uncharacterized protein n=1 Tax=Anguilla anguilla TaxID=7936 RepID=A0A0E9WJ64_ANGAN
MADSQLQCVAGFRESMVVISLGSHTTVLNSSKGCEAYLKHAHIF